MAGPMEGIVTHKFIHSNGIKLHYVEAGSGPTVLLLHGFPDFWYGWRHQIPAFVAAGYHVVAPDLRGFGESEIPDSPDKYTAFHNVGDIVGLLDALELKQALVVGHDWGSMYGANLVLFRPDRVKAIVLLGVPYFPRTAETYSVDTFREIMGDDMYISVFQKPGVAESLFKAAKNEDIFSAFLLRWNTSKNLVIPPFIADEPLPQWLTKEDLKVYAKAFDKTGWTGGFNHYRAHKESWELLAAWTKVPLPARVPVMQVTGRQDISPMMMNISSDEEFVKFKATCKQNILGLKAHHVIDGTHFMHQEKPDEVNKLVLSFLQQYKD